MNAVLSGRAGVAVLLEGGKLFSLHADEPDQLVPRCKGEYSYLLGDSIDLEFLDGVEPDAVRVRLETAVETTEALDVALVLLDREIPEEIRVQAAEDLEALLLHQDVTRALETILWAKPLPPAADLRGALQCAKQHTDGAIPFLRDLLNRQTAIRAVRQGCAA